jgi:hypothetical protein
MLGANKKTGQKKGDGSFCQGGWAVWVSEYDYSSTLASGGALSEERIVGPAIPIFIIINRLRRKGSSQQSL